MPVLTTLVEAIRTLQPAGPAPDAGAVEALERLFDVQVASRHCDLAARWLRGQG